MVRGVMVRRVLRWVLVGIGGLLGLFLVWVLILVATNPGARDTEAWERAADAPRPLSEVASTVVDDGGGEQLFVAGGFRSPVAGTSTGASRWDPGADEWDRLPDMPGPRHHAAAAAIDGAAYVSGGGSSAFSWTPRTNLWVLEPGADSWEELAELPEGRLGHRMEVVDGLLYLIGGEGPSGDVLIYDPEAQEWSSGEAIPVPRDHLGSAVVDDQIWAIGGRSGDGMERRVDIYDPATDRWEEGPELPRPVSAMVTGVVDDAVHVVGGEDPQLFGGRVLAVHLTADVAGDSAWQEAPLPIFDVHGAGGGTVDGELVVAGGSRRQGPLTPLAFTGATQRYEG
jgi:N-acetylneuraminic acid mutarotase